jgi:WD40 repeat protein
MEKIFLRTFLCAIIVVNTFYCSQVKSQNYENKINLQNWIQAYSSKKYLPSRHDGCCFNNDASFLAVSNNIDRIWIFDTANKRIISVLYNEFGGFLDTGFRLSDDGAKLAVYNNMPNIYPDKILEIMPLDIMSNDWVKRYKSFWIYDTKSGNFVKRIDSVVIPYTTTGIITLGSKVCKDDVLIEGSGAAIKKTDGTEIGFAQNVAFIGTGYSPFCFSSNSEELITPLTGGFSNGFQYGVLAESINIKTNELKNIYVYSDYELIKAELSKGTGYFGPVTAVARSGNGKYLALQGNLHNFTLFETDTGKIITAKRSTDFRNYNCGCFCLNYSGSLVARQSSQPSWEIIQQTQKLLAAYKKDFNFGDGRGGRVIIHDTDTMEIKVEVLVPIPLIVTSIAFSQNDKYIVTGTIWGHVFVWDISNGKLMKHFSLDKKLKDSKNITKTIVGFYKDTDEIVVTYLERNNKSGYVYKYKISNDNETKLFDFPP